MHAKEIAPKEKMNLAGMSIDHSDTVKYKQHVVFAAISIGAEHLMGGDRLAFLDSGCIYVTDLYITGICRMAGSLDQPNPKELA